MTGVVPEAARQLAARLADVLSTTVPWLSS